MSVTTSLHLSRDECPISCILSPTQELTSFCTCRCIFADLALRFGSVIGGLLNATFGNIVEVILSVAALEKGLYVVVATSLVGSVLSNLLLVLGEMWKIEHHDVNILRQMM